MTERALTIDRTGRRLEAQLSLPPGAPRGGVVLCHPHPQYGGTMYNGVIGAVAREALAAGFAALRFNFGGAGESEGAFSGGPEEVEDTKAAVGVLAAALPASVPIALVGYSFGAYVALLAGAADRRVHHVVAVAPPLGISSLDVPSPLPRAVSIIAAARDQFCDPERLARIVREHADRVRIAATIAADHFFSGSEAAVGAACRSVLVEIVSPTGAVSGT
jgi:alpha/beta superfamily hydrolase